MGRSGRIKSRATQFLIISSILTISNSGRNYYGWWKEGRECPKPFRNGSPMVQQITATAVEVSWKGLLNNHGCFDSVRVLHYPDRKGFGEARISEKLSKNSTSHVVTGLEPLQKSTFGVIAVEEKGNVCNISPLNKITTHYVEEGSGAGDVQVENYHETDHFDYKSCF